MKQRTGKTVAMYSDAADRAVSFLAGLSGGDRRVDYWARERL